MNIRGIKCSMDYYALADFLRLLAEKNWAYYVPWCLLNGVDSIRDQKMDSKDLLDLEKYRIWELELQCYPQCVGNADIDCYQDFLSSSCDCCLLYFDCGFLEIYIKHSEHFQQFWAYLAAKNADDLQVITHENDTRTRMSV